MAIEHDRIFKELICTFFAEFMELFLTQAYEMIDFEQYESTAKRIITY